jgi:16S rRNA (adenine1518-N6/adenine1519-N6)-dimethyltransferase
MRYGEIVYSDRLTKEEREFAQRLPKPPTVGSVRTTNVWIVEWLLAAYGFGVGRAVFRPSPRVDSAAVVLTPLPPRPPGEQAAVRDLARAAFSRRRKQIRTILRAAPEYALDPDTAESLLAGLGISPTARPETLGPELFVDLARRLTEHNAGR